MHNTKKIRHIIALLQNELGDIRDFNTRFPDGYDYKHSARVIDILEAGLNLYTMTQRKEDDEQMNQIIAKRVRKAKEIKQGEQDEH